MIKITKKSDMPTKLIRTADVLEVSYKENPDTTFLEFIVTNDNTIVIQEPPIEDDLTTFHCEISITDWMAIKSFIDTQLK